MMRTSTKIGIAAKRWLPLTAVVTMAATATAQAACPLRSTPDTHVFAAGLCLVVETFGKQQAGPTPVLVVVVHGDISDGGAATYHADFARTVVRPGVVTVALTRPGYTDATGRTSEGSTLGRGDNYTTALIAAVAGAVEALKKHHRSRHVVYVGHSGGAAIGGVLIGRRRRLIDAALLISCPCDIAAWLRARGRSPWERSLSPSDFAHRVPLVTRVVAMTGVNDDNTYAWIAHDYADRLARRGVAATFEPVEGVGHGFSGLKPAAVKALERILVP
jgi:hypothetical protein